MGVLADLSKVGLKQKLVSLIDEKLVGGKEQERKKLLVEIDEHGLTDRKIAMLVGSMQRNQTLKRGLFSELKTLKFEFDVAMEKYDDTADEADQVAEEVMKEAEAEIAQQESPQEEPEDTKEPVEELPEGEGTVAEESATEANGEAPEVSSDAEVLSDSDIASIEAKVREQADRTRARLMAQAAKKRRDKERRLGLKAEELEAIKRLKDSISKMTLEKKEKQDEIKAINEKIKAARDEINKIRPSKSAKKADGDSDTPDVDGSHRELITEFVRLNPNTNSKVICSGTNLDKRDVAKALKQLCTSEEVIKHGRGPYTTYTIGG